MAEGTGSNTNGLRLLPDGEYNDRRTKGLSFTCEEKYSPEHIRKNRTHKLKIVSMQPVVKE